MERKMIGATLKDNKRAELVWKQTRIKDVIVRNQKADLNMGWTLSA